MTGNLPIKKSPAHDWLRSRNVWFWAAAITVVSVLALWGGSQIARWMGQDVNWYTGFGQWLGALGSLIAAAAALWIAVTERRHTDARAEADLIREAALVRVTVTKYRPGIYHDFSIPGIRIKNCRSSRIFDLELIRVVIKGNDSLSAIPFEKVEFYLGTVGSLDKLPDLEHPLEADQSLNILTKEVLLEPTDYVSVQYTDSSGRRWEVDTERRVSRL